MPKRRKIITIDAPAELARIRERRRLANRRRYSSRLDRWRREILALSAAGASCNDIRIWLAGQLLRVAESTVRRWLHKHGGGHGQGKP